MFLITFTNNNRGSNTYQIIKQAFGSNLNKQQKYKKNKKSDIFQIKLSENQQIHIELGNKKKNHFMKPNLIFYCFVFVITYLQL